MLPHAQRLHTPRDYSAVVRSGRRAGTSTLVVHLLAAAQVTPTPARAGFVVSGKIGNSVVRHRITRRLRPLVRDRLPLLPAGTDLVVGALPAAAAASSTTLEQDLRFGISVAARRAGVTVTG